MKLHKDYTAQEIFSLLNESAECNWIEAKGDRDIHHGSHGQKAGKDDYHTLMESICSFSNEPGLGGGIILLGIGENRADSDQRFSVDGVADVDKAQADIATQCKEVFNIPVHPEIMVDELEGRNVLKICVSELADNRKPLYFKKMGLPSGAYRRTGSADLKCTDEDLYVFYQDSSVSFDQTPIKGATVKDVDPDALKRYRALRENVKSTAEELTYNDQELLEALGCVNPEDKNQLNLAGVLLFGSYKLQRRLVPTMRIDYIRVNGNKWVETADDTFRTIDMLGPLLLMVYRIVDAVNADLPKGFRLKEGDLQAQSTGLPVKVLREAVVNAVMHRSYKIDRPTQIIRYDNRIEIINAGYSLKSEEKYNSPGSDIRNKVIAPVFHDTNLAETKGTGIRRMQNAMKEAGMAVPTYESDRAGNTFTIRLLLHHFLEEEDLSWLKKYNVYNLNDSQRMALIFLRETGAVDNRTYRQMNDCDTLTASHDLRSMRDLKLLMDKGKGPSTYYIPGINFIAHNISLNDQAIQNIPDSGLSIPGNWVSVTEKHVNDQVHSFSDQVHSFSDQAPGLSDQAPGLSDQAPGLSDQAPGLSDQAPGLSDQAPEISQELRVRLDALGQREHNVRNIKSLITALCSVRPMKRSEIAKWLKRDENYVKNKFLKQMVADRQLRYLYPDMVNHPEQAYLANKEKGPHE